LELQYADYAFWQRQYLQGEVLDKKVAYWKEKLQGIAPLSLPLDFPRPTVQSTKGALAEFKVDKTTTDRLQKLGQQQGTTLFMTMLAAFKVLLYRYTGQEDICVGTPIAGREQQEVEGLIGFFVNTLALRTEVNGNESFIDLLQKVKTATLEAYEHGEVPFEKVVEAVVKERDMSRNPLFQVMLIVGNTLDIPELNLGEVIATPEFFSHSTAKFDLTFGLTETSEGLVGLVEYSTALYQPATITSLTEHFTHLLSSIVSRPSLSLGKLALLSQAEQHQLLSTFKDTKVAYHSEITLPAIFEQKVAQSPDSLALVEEDKQFSYKDLNERANQLAHYLKSKGVAPQNLVPVCLQRSTELVISLLAIVKIGAAYVPIDPDYPADRIAFMLHDTGATLVLTNQQSHLKLSPTENLSVLDLDKERAQIHQQPTENLLTTVAPHDLAYVIYTSGSTGRPKGVLLEHAGLLNLVHWHNKEYNVYAHSRATAMAGVGFDAFGWELWPYLSAGAAVYIISNELRLAPHLLTEFFYLHRISHSFISTALVPEFINSSRYKEMALQYMLTGGDHLGPLDVEGLNYTVVNNYGPTEYTVVTTNYVVKKEDQRRSPPIGRPITNTGVVILNEQQSLVPEGVFGELYVGGAGLARGYLNQQQLTEEKFVTISLANQEPIRLYRSGDRARWLPDGNIEYLGRIDNQVKIRGYRIELGEIESVLQQSGLVRSAVVVVKEQEKGEKRLIAYIVAGPKGKIDLPGLMAYVNGRLPGYMVPGVWVEVENLPLTANGKIDKAALPEVAGATQGVEGYEGPRSEMEEKLVRMWQELLKVEHIGIHDSFFHLGGHSLLAMRLNSLIRKELQIEVSIRDLFTHHTIAQLAAYILNQQKNFSSSSIIAVQTRPEIIPLSFSQERLWFIDQLEGSVQYHMPAILKLKGTLNKEALKKALQTIINRHEVLRTVIRSQEGKPYQYIKEEDSWQLNTIAGAQYEQDPEGLQQYIEQLIEAPFDLSKDDMLRTTLISLNDQEHRLVITMHHIASDGWSASIFVKELIELYASYVEKRPPILAPLNIQYADYALWQRQHLQGELMNTKKAYWKEKLQGIDPLQLPTDYRRPAVQSTRGAMVRFTIEKDVSTQLQELSQQQGATLFMTLLAAFKVLLYRYTNAEDICVGTPIAGRQQQEVEGLIGFFVNTLALRSRINSDASFLELLQQVKATTLEAYEHGEMPFEKVVETVVKERDMSRSPLFQVMLVLQNIPEIPRLLFGDVELLRESYEHKTAKLDVTFFIAETSHGLEGSIEYCTDLFSKATIGRMLGHFKELLSSVVKQPDQKISELSLLPHREAQQLLSVFNTSKATYPKDKSIVALFEEQAAKTPDKVALIFEQDHLTYRELNQRANQLALYLRGKGLKEEVMVPVCMERSLDMMVAILAILKAGAAYVPIDPAYPSERILYMLYDTKASLVISSYEKSSQLLGINGIEIIEIDTLPVSHESAENLSLPIDPHHLAYIIYTSGSTGKPKGVLVEHSNVVSLVKGVDYVNLSQEDVLLSTGSPSFDATTFEYWGMLLNGGSLILYPEDKLLNSERLKEEIRNRKVTKIWFTSSWFNSLVDTNIEVFEGLQTILVGGEKLSEKHITKLRHAYPHIEVINGYGPTENTTFSLTHSIKETDLSGSIPIGKPLSNRTAYIVDQQQKIVPIGVVGEIHVGGAGLSRGYLNHPELTAAKFILDPFSKEEGARIYKTGDLGRWLADGTIEYLGRKDDQVKIRGYRIELGEIENVLQECDLVRQGVVVVKEEDNGNKRLVGYVVAEGNFNREGIVAYLKSKLPEYMVPALWVELESLPLTANGKIDKRALPDPDPADRPSHEYVAPLTEAEIALAEIWLELLQLDKIGVNDNFFELGGHSLIITQMLDRVRKLGYEITAKDLFAYQTIEQQSKFMSTSLMLINASREGKYVLPVRAGKSSNIPMFAMPEYITFCKLAPYLNREQPLYSIEKTTHENEEDAAAFYISEIRKAYPRGTFCLVGFCRWAGIALEMAHQLKAQGEEVPVLVLMEYYPAGSRLSRTSMKYINLGIKRIYNEVNNHPAMSDKVKFINDQLSRLRRFIITKIKATEKIKHPNFFKQAAFKPYSGKVVLINARERPFGLKEDADMDWSERFTGELEKFTIDGDHLGVWFKKGPLQIAEKLNTIMEKVNKTYKAEQASLKKVLSFE
jgi:amino acid adenylation domain-containing protein